MASIEIEKKTGVWQIRFRFGGQPFKRSLKTDVKRTAESAKSRVEETIRLIESGRLEIPERADVATFIMSDGKLAGKKVLADAIAFKDAVAGYFVALPKGAKAETTVYMEQMHARHLVRNLKPGPIAKIDYNAIQSYVNARSKQSWHGKPIGGDTISKELKTFRRIWEWATRAGHVSGDPPTKGVKLPMQAERQPFRTREEIVRIIRRTRPSKDEKAELWECLFLSVPQIIKFLEHVKSRADWPQMYPMISFAAWTGARRSEMLRSRVEDWNFENGIVAIREKKRVRGRSLSFRLVPIHHELRKAMEPWVKQSKGLLFDFTKAQAVHYFRMIRQNSKWKVVRGFHVLRHSFASNLASRGVNQAMIDAWMGHTTEEMRRRYAHLFPSSQASAIATLTNIDGVLGG